MKIQYISYVNDRSFEYENITCKTFTDPLAFDAFDITVVSFQNSKIWCNQNRGVSRVDCIKDLQNIGVINSASKRSLVIFLLPQDYTFRSDFSYERYHSFTQIRNILPDISLLISQSLGISGITLAPGAEITQLNHGDYNSAFSISVQGLIDENCIQRGKENGITIYRAGNYIFTTIKISDSKSLLDFLEDIGIIKMDSIAFPDWLDTISFLDESDLLAQLDSDHAKITGLENECLRITKTLDEYKEKKLILCTKGKELQDNIVSMLEEILPREEPFIDEGEEDYRFETNSRAFLFEVKGSEKSLKRDHISKADNHVQVYIDSHEEDQEKIEPKGILIFSEEIEKPLSEHLPYVETQLELAKKYGVLVIPASSFLRIYESFRKGEITSYEVQEELWNKTGLWSD